MQNNRTHLTKAEFDRYEVSPPCNKIIVRVEHKEIKTPVGIKLSFNDDVLYAEGNDSHVANMSTVMGVVVKQPDRLYFNPRDINSMSWECGDDIETLVDDTVWSHPLNVRNCDEIEVEGELYQVWDYGDLFCAKREVWVNKWDGTKKTVVVPLNGYAIIEPIYKPRISEFDVLPQELDKTRGIVRFTGSDNKRYHAKGAVDLKGIKEGDTVVIDERSYIVWLERFQYNSNFDNGKQYYVIQKRYLLAIL